MKKVLILVLTVLLCSCSLKEKNININDDLIQNLYNAVNPSKDANILKLLYENPNNFSNEYILAVALKDNISSKKEGETISKEAVETSAKQIFGNNIKLTHERAYLFFDQYCGYDYDENKKQYELLHGCDGNTYETFLRKIIKAEQKGNKIIITEKSLYIKHDWESSSPSTIIYNNIIDKNLIKNENNVSKDINIDDYLSDASTYEYIFKKEKGNYIFVEFKKVS